MVLAARDDEGTVIDAQSMIEAEVLHIAKCAPAESITALGAQWREAHAIAEAQEQRLEALEVAAAKLYGAGATEEGELDVSPEAVSDSRSWLQRAQQVDVALGLPAQEESANCAWRLVDGIAEQLLGLQPTNVQEAAVKFGVLLMKLRAEFPEADESGRLGGFLEDLARLAEPSAH
jgi:hypothetical protein